MHLKDKISFVCPACKTVLTFEAQIFSCAQCGKRYPVVSGVPDFRPADGYWCNVSREKMQQLNTLARTSGDWRAAAQAVIPQYAAHFTPLARGDSQFLWPTTKDSVILDAGAMWGGITIPAAQYHGEVYALDKTIETLEFLDIRAKQMGLTNVHPVAGDLNASLPFSDNTFDLVVVNGVLEWVGFSEDIVLEKHWSGKIAGGKYVKSPRQMQQEALREMIRVLKPGGAIYIAIENRAGIQYPLGMPDDHMNVKFITFLPRFLANWITRLRKGTSYRTYIYTPQQLSRLVTGEGFGSVSLFGIFPHYNTMDSVTPFEVFPIAPNPVAPGANTGLRWRVTAGILRALPRRLQRYFSPSLGIFARKPGGGFNFRPARLLTSLAAGGILSGDLNNYRVALVPSRQGDNNSSHYVVYDLAKKVPVYFVKVSRNAEMAEALKYEVAQLSYAQKVFAKTVVADAIPSQVRFIDADGVPMEVTNYMHGKNVDASFWNGLKSLTAARLKLKSSFFQKIFHWLNRFATRRWLRQIDPVMRGAIDLLSDWQKASAGSKPVTGEELREYFARQNTLIKSAAMQTPAAKAVFADLDKAIAAQKDLAIPRVFQHADYDLCNILREGKKIRLVDFEHAEQNTLPFFDLANLFFSPLLVHWRKVGQGKEFSDFADEFGWSAHIRKWVSYYSERSGIALGLLQFLPQIAILEQNTKQYPNYREPHTYPMYGEESIRALLSLHLTKSAY